MSCKKGCFELEIPACSSIKLLAGLPVTTTFEVRIQKPGSKNIYNCKVTTDDTGALMLDKHNLPQGFINHYGGAIKLQLLIPNPDMCNNIQPLIFCSEPYDCVLFNVFNMGFCADCEGFEINGDCLQINGELININ